MRMTDYVTAHVDAHDTRTGAIKLHGRAAFDGMHKAGRLAAETLDMLVPHMVPGVTTGEIDRLIYDFVGSQGGVPATLGYRGYTHSSCISVNHVVCHGRATSSTSTSPRSSTAGTAIRAGCTLSATSRSRRSGWSR